MEIEDAETIARPDRTPDYISPAGSCFWWHEMVYIGALGEVCKILRSQENGKLYVRQIKRMNQLHEQAQQSFENFTYLDFEKAILDESEKS